MKSPDRDAADEVERVARAICAADNHAWPEDDYNGRFQRRAFETQARAAMAAMPSISELATLRRRVEEMRRNRLEEAEALRRRVAELEDIGRESLGPWRQFAAYLVFICALVDMGEIEPFDEHTVISHAQGGGGTAMLTMGPLKALGHAFAKLQALLAPLPPGRNDP